jgi:hypothetical protein
LGWSIVQRLLEDLLTGRMRDNRLTIEILDTIFCPNLRTIDEEFSELDKSQLSRVVIPIEFERHAEVMCTYFAEVRAIFEQKRRTARRGDNILHKSAEAFLGSRSLTAREAMVSSRGGDMGGPTSLDGEATDSVDAGVSRSGDSG